MTAYSEVITGFGKFYSNDIKQAFNLLMNQTIPS